MLPRLLSLFVVLFAVLSSTSARAAVIAVTPVRLHLSEERRSELLELTNNGAEPARFQITAHAWRQSPDGKMILEPTNDLVFYPSIFDIDPGQTRLVRVASVVRGNRAEKAYRLIVDELPDATATGGLIRVLTQLSLPVFVQTPDAKPTPALETTLNRGSLSVVLENRGTAYFKGVGLRVVGRSKSGAILFERSLPAWYVLTRGRRAYTVEIPGEACRELGSVVTVAQTEEGAVRSTLNVSSQSDCSG